MNPYTAAELKRMKSAKISHKLNGPDVFKDHECGIGDFSRHVNLKKAGAQSSGQTSRTERLEAQHGELDPPQAAAPGLRRAASSRRCAHRGARPSARVRGGQESWKESRWAAGWDRDERRHAQHCMDDATERG